MSTGQRHTDLVQIATGQAESGRSRNRHFERARSMVRAEAQVAVDEADALAVVGDHVSRRTEQLYRKALDRADGEEYLAKVLLRQWLSTVDQLEEIKGAMFTR